MGRFKIISAIGKTQEILKEYDDIEKVIRDMSFKDPSIFFIGDGQTRQGYMLEEFIKEFRKGVERSNYSATE